jgi:hypothetical protein
MLAGQKVVCSVGSTGMCSVALTAGGKVAMKGAQTAERMAAHLVDWSVFYLVFHLADH